MRDDSQIPDGTTRAQDRAPLPYQSPGAHRGSQWITDDQPGGGWLVGCLLAVCGVGGVLAALAWWASWFAGWGMGL